jgi:hypothetical protein
VNHTGERRREACLVNHTGERRREACLVNHTGERRREAWLVHHTGERRREACLVNHTGERRREAWLVHHTGERIREAWLVQSHRRKEKGRLGSNARRGSGVDRFGDPDMPIEQCVWVLEPRAHGQVESVAPPTANGCIIPSIK